jgi:maltose/maltodextrin transport system permease protein
MQPGFKVGIGFANYSRMLLDADFRGPFVSIFIWTVVFAGLTVLFSTRDGHDAGGGAELGSAEVPHAVPHAADPALCGAGFISILVFKGLFNQNFGEINGSWKRAVRHQAGLVCHPFLAKVMILIVNTWLGYPYMMILCMGLLKAIPEDLYEASPWTAPSR